MALPLSADEDDFGIELSDAPPDHLLLKIQSFSKLWSHGVESHESSHIIVAGNYKWKLIIYPNGRECENEGDHISVYVSVAETDHLPKGWEIIANLSIFLHNQVSDKYLCFRGKLRRFDAKNLKWGFSMSKRIWADASSGYLVDDRCAFGAEIFVTKPKQAVECLFLHDCKICDFLELKVVWASEEFLAGGLRWKIVLFPYCGSGYSPSGKSSYISIRLRCVEAKSFAPHEKVKADFSIRIKTMDNDNVYYESVKSHWFTSGGGENNCTFAFDIDHHKMHVHVPDNGFIVIVTQISVLDVVYTPKDFLINHY